MNLAAILAIAGTAVRRLFRDRSNIFFVFVFPMLLVVLIGTQFGGDRGLRLAVAVVDRGPEAEQVLASLGEVDAELVRLDDRQAVLDAVARQEVDGGVIVPFGFSELIRTREPSVVEFVGPDGGSAAGIEALVRPAVARVGVVVTVADVIQVLDGTSLAGAIDEAGAVFGLLPGVRVERHLDDSEGGIFDGLGRFDLGAVQNLLLFVFLSSLTNAAALIQSREYGVTRRLLAHPLSPRALLAGEALGRIGVALVQGIYIVVGTALLFGVNWGSPVGTGLVLLAFAAAAAGAGLLLGSVARSQQQAGAIGVGLGLGLAAIGGSMLPLELMPDAVRAVADVVPHSWAYEAFADLVRGDGGVGDVLPEVGVLFAMAAVLHGLGALRLGRTLREGG